MKIGVSVQEGPREVGVETWRAACSFEGFQVSVSAGDRALAIAQVRRLAYAHLSTLEQPPRHVEFEVVA
jgi:hypothetical protein